MQLEYYKPAVSLRAFIKLYAFYCIEKERKINPIKFIPMGLPYLVFNLEDEFSIYKSNHNKGILSDGAIITGQQLHYYHLVPHGTLASLSVIFQPTGLFRLLHVPVHELVDYGYPAEEVLKSTLKPLYEKILGASKSVPKMIQILDTFFLTSLFSCNYQYRYVEFALNCIHESNGMITISQLLERFNISGRTFRRRFLEAVGISCKKYIGLIRMNYIMGVVKNLQTVDINWSRIAYNSGYYDQMHFIKTFKQFCGENPTTFIDRYHDSSHELEKYFLSARE